MAKTVVIAGAGHAAGQAVASLKQHKFAGRIILAGDEPYLPYQRPPLSKKFLAGEMPAERLFVKPPSFYEDDRIEVHLDARVTGIDRDAKAVSTAAGGSFDYDKLIVATGSRVRKLPVPGAELAGIYYLRSIADVDAIRAEVGEGRRLVIIGAGYIGLEVAAVCRKLGLDVTVVEMADRVMSRVVSEQVSSFYAAQHEAHGVKLQLSTGLKEFAGSNGRIDAVITADGRSIACDFAIVGVGIVPNVELAGEAGLELDNGIVVDDRCLTSDRDIYAVGDCTSHPSAIYGRRIRLESVHNALEQAKTAADNICGIETHYDQVPWFWSDQYDLKLQIAGLSQGYDAVVLRGDTSGKSFACFYLLDGVLLAVDAVNSPREFMQAKALIARRAVIDPADLANPDKALKDLG
jgi:3-phenylpropionate/trans-cinnamate dioxygenase ferredoxin reductase subunit